MGTRMYHLSTGVHASVYAFQPSSLLGSSTNDTGLDGWRAVKIVHAPRSAQRTALRPHDIKREVDNLRELDHPNVIKVLAYDFVEGRMEHRLTLPLLAFTLSDLLASHSREESAEEEGKWMEIFRSIAFQLLHALAHLHERHIAHRDVKPDNIMCTWTGILQLIDFGTAFSPHPTAPAASNGMECDDEERWIEKEDDMVCAVGTGPYRAPELLFSPTKYNAEAIDMWATGCVLAEFWINTTPSDLDVSDSDSSEEGSDPLEAPNNSGREKEKHLFDATYGELGLAASIFRLRGSPSSANWPGFGDLQDAGKIAFDPSPGVPLSDVVADLPADLTGKDTVDLIDGMLQLDPSRRTPPCRALNSALFSARAMSLPVDYPITPPGGHVDSLRELLEPWLVAARERYLHLSSQSRSDG